MIDNIIRYIEVQCTLTGLDYHNINDVRKVITRYKDMYYNTYRTKSIDINFLINNIISHYTETAKRMELWKYEDIIVNRYILQSVYNILYISYLIYDNEYKFYSNDDIKYKKRRIDSITTDIFYITDRQRQLYSDYSYNENSSTINFIYKLFSNVELETRLNILNYIVSLYNMPEEFISNFKFNSNWNSIIEPSTPTKIFQDKVYRNMDLDYEYNLNLLITGLLFPNFVKSHIILPGNASTVRENEKSILFSMYNKDCNKEINDIIFVAIDILMNIERGFVKRTCPFRNLMITLVSNILKYTDDNLFHERVLEAIIDDEKYIITYYNFKDILSNFIILNKTYLQKLEYIHNDKSNYIPNYILTQIKQNKHITSFKNIDEIISELDRLSHYGLTGTNDKGYNFKLKIFNTDKEIIEELFNKIMTEKLYEDNIIYYIIIGMTRLMELEEV
jgi:hypothetical protein